ncbi:AMP-binding protein [Pseudosulfitobacter sp. DSM 107133]|uniref:class I adenylate-forming enzyme family protein n=1 Tax=Pseudosulfitobacter sp. DSM 107133 TaxID=2883100 RepID=UPI000DF29046|nr:AMP-binding protein [Pseudosulfitobacter sp. DSM 107133]UOA27785.1 Long-chain-fatty-acid--CoA ligase [Pseudosulfitobacter sp. DSM 107133]
MNLATWLERTAAADSRAQALYSGTQAVADYGTFDRLARELAGWLGAQGVAPGDRVAIFMANVPDYLVVMWGCWYAGICVVPINAKLHGREAAYILQDSGAKMVFATAAQAQALRAAQVAATIIEDLPQGTPVIRSVHRNEYDLAWLFYTSGTTGQPKGVMLSHGNLMAMALSYFADVDQVHRSDAALYAAPMSHGAGLYNLMHVRMGARHVCPASQGFDPAEILDLAEHFGNVHMFAAPTMVTRLTAYATASGRSGQGLRTVVYAGGPMYLADILAARAALGDVFVQIYGQGECPMAITALSRADVSGDDMARVASVGQAQSCVELGIGDSAGAFLPAGQAGEIMVRGAPVMLGYWNNPRATAETLRDGWLMTGDIGMLDAQGYLTLQDRSKDVIISGGSNIYPREVEEVLQSHASVQEVSVVGRPHADWGEEVVAFVVGTATDADLDALCRDHIARFKAPKAYIHVDALPKNNYGKVLKTELRALL